jgi:hypothetical protein
MESPRSPGRPGCRRSARDADLEVVQEHGHLAGPGQRSSERSELERTPHPTDRRARLIRLTDAGRRRLETDGANVEGLFGALDALRVGVLETVEALERQSVRTA